MKTPLRAVIYVSTSNVEPRSVDAVAIDHDARRRNAEHGITGYLHHEDATFLQYIEGGPEKIETLLANLRRDWRHSDLTVILDGPAEARLFESWSMAFSDGETRPYAAGSLAAQASSVLKHATPAELVAFIQAATRSTAAWDGDRAIPKRDDPAAPRPGVRCRR